jgi:hypothetical protein
MATRKLGLTSASASVALALLAGCSGGLQNATPSGTAPQSRFQASTHISLSGPLSKLSAVRTLHSSGDLIFRNPEPDAASGYVAGSSFYGAVELWTLPDSSNNAPDCSIATEYVNDLAFDAKGTLWAPTPVNPTSGAGFVYTYPKGNCTASSFELTAANGQPADIAIGTKDEYVSYIVGLPSGSTFLPASIDVFPDKKTAPSTSLTNSNIVESFGIAIDKKGDVFWSGESQIGGGTPGVVEFAGGKGGGKLLGLTGFGAIVGLDMDKNQNLVAADAGNTTLDIWKPPYKGKPAATIALQGSPVDVKLDKANKNVYVADVANSTIDVYTYPKGKYEYSISNGFTATGSEPIEVIGVAVSPPGPN